MVRASSGSVRAGHDVERLNDKAGTIKARQREEGQAKGKPGEGLGMLMAQNTSQGVYW